MARRKFTAPTSFLLAVEGANEKALCQYLRDLSPGKDQRFDIHNLRGGSPDILAEGTRKRAAAADYDQVWLLMDAEPPLSAAGHKSLKACQSQLILSRPCLEAEHLRLLGQKVLSDSDAWIRRLCQVYSHPGSQQLKAHFAEAKNWAKALPMADLQTRRLTNPWLDQMLTLFQL